MFKVSNRRLFIHVVTKKAIDVTVYIPYAKLNFALL